MWRDRVSYVLATWFGCGLVPGAPGTVGTLGALPLYFMLRSSGPIWVAASAVALLPVAIWAASRTAQRLQLEDPQVVVIDEVVGVLVTLTAATSLLQVALGVVLFRVFDQWKPFPARLAEQRLPGGYGIVLDDVAAGLWGAMCLLIGRKLALLG